MGRLGRAQHRRFTPDPETHALKTCFKAVFTRRTKPSGVCASAAPASCTPGRSPERRRAPRDQASALALPRAALASGENDLFLVGDTPAKDLSSPSATHPTGYRHTPAQPPLAGNCRPTDDFQRWAVAQLDAVALPDARSEATRLAAPIREFQADAVPPLAQQESPGLNAKKQISILDTTRSAITSIDRTNGTVARKRRSNPGTGAKAHELRESAGVATDHCRPLAGSTSPQSPRFPARSATTPNKPDIALENLDGRQPGRG